jgi:sporulation protein YlmC with PRC-barrel domain
MTDNLVSAISRFLTPELVGRMASVAGLDRGTTQSAVGAAVPAILSSLADLAARPGGARQLADTIAEQSEGMLSDLPQTLGTAGMSAERGSGMLASLLGSGVLDTLVSTLSRFVGIGEGATRTLLGLLAPAVLGVLGREQRAAGLETGGLARMLMGQKYQMAAAMPAGLSALLSSRVRVPEGTETIRPGPRTYAEGRSFEAPERETTPRMTGASVRRPGETRETARSDWSWAYWVIPLLALGGLLWYLLPTSQTGTDRTATAPTQQQGVPVTQPTTPGIGQRGTTQGAPAKVIYFSRAEPGWIPIGIYYQQDIYNKAGEKIGTIKDLMMGQDGRIQAAVLSVGRFLGLGERDVAVPLASIEMARRADGSRIIIVDVVKETLQNAPAYEHSSAVRLK